MLSADQLNQFDRDGFLVLENVLELSDRQPLIDEYAELVERLSHERGHIGDDWQQLSFEQKFSRLIASDPDAYEHLDISLPLIEDLSVQSGMHAGDEVFNLLTHAAILNIVEPIVGTEIYSNPVQHVRIKPPEFILNKAGRGNSNISRTGWHQDAAVIVEGAASVPILTVWIAMTDATPEMGCMQAIPGSHKWQGIAKHCPGRSGVGEIFIPEELVNEHQPVSLAVRAGGVVLLHRNTWHGAGPNTSDRIRWSLDLRYQPPGYTTGRDCFPGFLARSSINQEQVVNDAATWRALWTKAQHDIVEGRLSAVFNERWHVNRDDTLCA